MIQARVITQIGRRRGQADTRRAIASARIAVAHRAMLGVQWRAASRVRGNDRRLADFIGHGQLRPELASLAGDVGAILAGADRLAQLGDALFQPGLFRFGRHRGDQALDRLDELQLLAVFGFV